MTTTEQQEGDGPVDGMNRRQKRRRRRRRRRKRRKHGDSVGREEEMSLQCEIITRKPNDSPHDDAGSNLKQQGSRPSPSSSSSHSDVSSSSSSSAIMPVVATTTNVTTMDSLSDPLLMVVAEMLGPPPARLHDKMNNSAFIKDLTSMLLVCQRWKKVVMYHDSL